jgi:serine/threonine protein kinase
MGAVFEAEDFETGRRVALKVLSHTLDLPDARERFFREGRLAASLNHPNSVYVFGTEEIGGTPVIAMELVSGGTLQDRVQAHGPLPIGEAVDCVLQLIAGLEAAQRIGILHRDVKPSNCYRAEDGTVKIGDFGLSISTTIRTEPSLTATGAFLGTPAFCSPEQLRGDELNVRSDIYSVGATLFYLLTGRTPFEAKNPIQMLATVLEQPAPSPRRFNPKIAPGLARVIHRSLEKQPGERFKTYHDLAGALAPFSSAAPSPATLGFRFVAGVLDMLFLGLVSLASTWLILGNPMDLLSLSSQRSPIWLLWSFGWFATSILYYSLFESRYGATPGKAICRLRVVGSDKNPPRFLRALLRASIFVLVPSLPSCLFYGFNAYANSSTTARSLVGFSVYGLLGLLFCTARRHNGFAGLHDLAGNIRVISAKALEARPILALVEASPPSTAARPTLGPYHVLESLGSPNTSLLGYDLRLLRKVWLRIVPVGTAPFPAPLRNLGRIGRLRWLSGRRSPTENWDAFEAPNGKPLLNLIQAPQPWSQVRLWLYDLAAEMILAEKEGTMPLTLDLDRVWITSDGRAKLLDFPAPGLQPESTQPSVTVASPPEFLRQFASATLRGDPILAKATDVTAATPLALPASFVRLPLHARDFLKKLQQLPDAVSIAAALKPLLQRLAVVSRLRRTGIAAGCLAFPLFACACMVLGASLIKQWSRAHPGVMEMNSLLQGRSSLRRWAHNRGAVPTDRQYAIYVASHYAFVITNQTTWTDGFTLAMVRPEERRFAEQSVHDHPSPSAAEIADADAALKPLIPDPNFLDLKKKPWLPLVTMGVILFTWVCLPALVAALAFRGGLLLRLAGVTFVRRDGAPASRLRIFWRALVAWSPLVLAVVLSSAHVFHAGSLLRSACAAILVLGLAIFSLALPVRGLQDRLAGTWPVPR